MCERCDRTARHPDRFCKRVSPRSDSARWSQALGLSRGATMRDADVRSAVLEVLREEHAGDDSTRIVQEMGIWAGTVRIDVAVINGELCGYELKSDRDTLARLPYQAEIYSKVFDRVHLVVGGRHARKARALVPKWWGITVAKRCSAGLKLTLAREAKRNPAREPAVLAQLLWREEALQALAVRGLDRGCRSKAAAQIHARLATSLSLDDLADVVREALKARSREPVSN